MTDQRGIPIRCACDAAPLLAMAGVDQRTGDPWVHIKAWKGKRLYVEALVSGDVKLKCRACQHWFRLRIVRGAPALQANKVNPLNDLGGKYPDNA